MKQSNRQKRKITFYIHALRSGTKKSNGIIIIILSMKHERAFPHFYKPPNSKEGNLTGRPRLVDISFFSQSIKTFTCAVAVYKLKII